VVENHGFIDGDNVCDTVTGVNHNTRAETYTASISSTLPLEAFELAIELTLGVESQNSLDSNVDTAETISVKHNLAHLLAVLKRVHRWLCQENLPTLSVDLELLVEGVIPEMLHVVPFLDNTVLHGVTDLEHCSSGGGLVTTHDVLDDNIAIGLFLGTQNRSAYNGRVLMLGEVLRGISDLEETGTSVED
jgi:hypothetical protein